ncbi:MAG: aldehyde dehydrogenase family protein, partial [Parvularculaceae bacterium]|nr:aldehyde dehydrogenase family protein [Parvularculaceae bacterium]
MAADTTRPIEAPVAPDLARLFEAQRAASRAEPPPSLEERRCRLDVLIAAVEANEARFVEAISADFGHRARQETVIAETLISIAAARHAKRHVAQWMRPRPVATPLHMAPGRSRLEPQPLGVVGIIAPWNYPVQLALSPASAALAAGN